MSSTRDIHIFESGNGGELALLSNDLVLSESLYQVVYISLFGGNVEASTLGNEIESEERSDYWANELVFPSKTSKQFNSITEKTLNEVALNSEGRLKIESAVKQDLQFLKKIVNLEVNILILDTNKVEIFLVLESIENQSVKQFQFIWDNAKNEIIIERTI
jgi:phage gp46-like protein